MRISIRQGGGALLAALLVAFDAGAQVLEPALPSVVAPASALLAVDQNRSTIVERVIGEWGERLASGAGISREDLREMLFAMRADQLLAASLAGSLDGLRDVIAQSLVAPAGPRETSLVRVQATVRPQALGDSGLDVVYVPVTPCRLVETRTSYAAVYQGGGPFSAGQVREYTVQGGNGVCLTQLPAGLNPAAVQLQVFAIPQNGVSGDVEVLPQGSAFGSTATLVFLGNLPFTSAGTAARINPGNNAIGVQVRSGVAHVAIDVVGYFRAPQGGYVASVAAGSGVTVGGTASNPTVSADTGYLQRRVSATCAVGSSIRAIAADGAVTCEPDDVGTGTVASLSQGTGITLSSNPITTTGTISVNTGAIQARVTGTCAAGSSIRAIDAAGAVACEPDDAGPVNAFVQGGNSFGTTAVIGTNDGQDVEIRADGVRVMRYHPNAISPNVIGGNANNNVTAGVRGATIAGGGVAAGNTDPDFAAEAPNRVTDHYGTVNGGYANQAGDAAGTTADASFGTVGGGAANFARGPYATVAGGAGNSAGANGSVVGGGGANDATGSYSAVGGGLGNAATGGESTVAGGYLNTASGDYSTVGGGIQNEATGIGAVVGGGGARGCGAGCQSFMANLATGHASTVPGGFDNQAGGDFSVAMGRRAKALGNGSFSFADGNDFDFSANSVNAFRVRATGGVRFVTDIDGTGATTWSCLAVAGAAWACASDRNLKHSLVELDGREVLEKLAAMPVYQWQPKGQNAHVKHYGPMAQDFHAAFGLGDDDTMIGMQDADGVALAAIRGLNEKVAQQAREISELRRTIDGLLSRTSQKRKTVRAE